MYTSNSIVKHDWTEKKIRENGKTQLKNRQTQYFEESEDTN